MYFNFTSSTRHILHYFLFLFRNFLFLQACVSQENVDALCKVIDKYHKAHLHTSWIPAEQKTKSDCDQRSNFVANIAIANVPHKPRLIWIFEKLLANNENERELECNGKDIDVGQIIEHL